MRGALVAGDEEWSAGAPFPVRLVPSAPMA